ncbi:MAG TPA: ABC transporter permease [Capsulimonadaceae bacterium]|jgi:molybdate transport system permease protein
MAFLNDTDRGPQGRRELVGLAFASAPLILFLAIPFVALVASISPAQWLHSVHSPDAISALALTLRTTLLSTVICIVGGLPVALLLGRHRFRGREFLDTLIDLPISVPPVVVGVALLMAFGRMGLIGKHFHAIGIDIGFTTAAVVLAQVVIASPFFIKAARAGIEGVDPRLENAARVLGANPWRVFWTVTFPLAKPGLLAGGLLAWARALSEFGATMMFAGNFPGRTQTLPLAVMSAFESDLSLSVGIATISLILSVVALVGAKLIARSWRTAW